MNINVSHLDAQGQLTQKAESLSHLAFAKHLAFSGVGLHRHPIHYLRFYSYYLEVFQFWSDNPNRFSLPAPFNHDPTEKNMLSNRIGKALADFLAKKYYSARFTHCYEDAMVRFGHQIKGKRPDLYCDNLREQFAIESKGFSAASISQAEMSKHKSQSQQGPIPVNFSIASVSFDLYRSPKVKFYDPINKDTEYHKDQNQQLRSLYYQSVLELIGFSRGSQERSQFDDFYSFRLFPPFLDLKLLVHRSILKREWGSDEWLYSIEKNYDREEETYIDLDGIGLTSR